MELNSVVTWNAQGLFQKNKTVSNWEIFSAEKKTNRSSDAMSAYVAREVAIGYLKKPLTHKENKIKFIGKTSERNMSSHWLTAVN